MSKQKGGGAVVAAPPGGGMTQERVELVRRTLCKGATDDELALFLQQCERTGLDPFARQIYAVKRYDSKERREVLAIQVGVDGLRLIAERTGKYAGQLGPQWCGMDGVWRDVWLGDGPPAAARVAVLRKDWAEPLWAVARYAAYVQTTKEGGPNRFWARLDDLMIAKVAECLALRRAFPQELSGLYAAEEMLDEDPPHRQQQPERPALPAPAEKPAEPAEAPASAPKPKPLADRIDAFEARLVEAGLCKDGDVVAHLRKSLRGLEGDYRSWPEAAAEDAVAAARAFAAAAKVRRIDALLQEKRQTWAWVAAASGIDPDAEVGSLPLEQFQRAEKLLKEMDPTAAPPPSGRDGGQKKRRLAGKGG